MKSVGRRVGLRCWRPISQKSIYSRKIRGSRRRSCPRYPIARPTASPPVTPFRTTADSRFRELAISVTRQRRTRLSIMEHTDCSRDGTRKWPRELSFRPGWDYGCYCFLILLSAISLWPPLNLGGPGARVLSSCFLSFSRRHRALVSHRIESNAMSNTMARIRFFLLFFIPGFRPNFKCVPLAVWSPQQMRRVNDGIADMAKIVKCKYRDVATELTYRTNREGQGSNTET